MRLFKGDCLIEMSKIPDGSVDLILTDPPYGTTACKWDSVIPFEPMWEQLKRIIKPNGAIVMTASQPFTSVLICSNLKMFKYELIWQKTKIQGFAQAPYRFMIEHEDIVVFSFGGCAKNANNRMKYNPQNLIYKPRLTKGKKANASEHRIRKSDQKDFVSEYTNYPKSVVSIGSEFKTIHPTQKPVALIEYLIRTYTNENETVLDFTMGSGTTGVACVNTNRKFIGIEMDEKYFEIAEKRINDAKEQLKFSFA
jgi:site-specific DNA-methyltransferase (adenine-specific)